MRTIEEINAGITIYYTPENRIYLIQDNYSHSFKRIKETLKYAKELGLTLPKDDEISINVLSGERYKRMMSIEFNSKSSLTNSDRGYLLKPGSGIYDWLRLA